MGQRKVLTIPIIYNNVKGLNIASSLLIYLSNYKCNLKNMVNLGQLLTKKIKIT